MDGTEVVGGVSDLFLRRPANWGGSVVSSGEGDPDIGGVGRGAQVGARIDLGRLKSKETLGSQLNRHFLNEE